MSDAKNAPDPEASKREAVTLFARRTAHDLNNIATVIRTYTELLLSDVTDERARSDLREVYEAAEAMVGYLRHIARFTRPAGKPLPLIVDTTLAETVAGVQDEDPELPVFLKGTTHKQVVADALWFADVMSELVYNAREASPEGGRVVVHVSTVDDAWVVIRVTDEGAGFAPSIDATAEDPFVTTKQGTRGAGFGLTLAASFARQSGGRLVRERIDGRTHVSLWLPAL